ncbi:hypothetical protein SS50377_20550 [Spironucleus salmonicida]|uniref:Myb-like DNA-binding domain-containing protein n=1 Tax=Spironucleus salmonicida TaxID=348837 RepID=V6LU00_9EUKA|nr:hypothetical protein SS50377_20550 [Spironucleus salmonicida]|eukprot:EST48085.1 hypothetical protein SS50377_11783 [Spironucleus salmonicida]
MIKLTPDEQNLLIQLTQAYEKNRINWQQVVAYFPAQNMKDLSIFYHSIIKTKSVQPVEKVHWNCCKDKELMVYVQQYGKSWKQIGDLMKIHFVQAKNRYYVINKKMLGEGQLKPQQISINLNFNVFNVK